MIGRLSVVSHSAMKHILLSNHSRLNVPRMKRHWITDSLNKDVLTTAYYWTLLWANQISGQRCLTLIVLGDRMSQSVGGKSTVVVESLLWTVFWRPAETFIKSRLRYEKWFIGKGMFPGWNVIRMKWKQYLRSVFGHRKHGHLEYKDDIKERYWSVFRKLKGRKL